MDQCCEEMGYFTKLNCEDHSSIYECPDVLISKSAQNEFGIIVHDGGTSEISISFCPWCGANLNNYYSVRSKIESIEKKALNKIKNQGGTNGAA